MAAKVPVLVSDIDGPIEVIDNGRYGMSFRSGDEKDLADKLRVAKNAHVQKDFIDLAYKSVLDRYDVNNTAEKYLQIYRKLISQ